MTSRERTLGMAFGVVAAAFVLYKGFGKYQEFKSDLDIRIEKKQDELAKVQNEKLLTAARERQWREYGRQTLAMEASQVQTRLREDLDRLADECGLTGRGSVKIGKPSNLGRAVRGQKNFVAVQPAALEQAQGQIDSVVRFLYRLHARPYLIRVKNLTLSRPSKAEDAVVSVDANLETPILPPTKLVARVQPVNLDDTASSGEIPRTQAKSPDDYQKSVVKRKLFQPFQSVEIKATGPTPASNSPLIEVTSADLRWSANGAGITGYKVYFGENTSNPTEMVGELPPDKRTLHRESLTIGPTYYWRVDTVHEDWEGETVTTKGDVWSFRVQTKPVVVASKPAAEQEVVPLKPPDDAEFTVARILSSPSGQYVVLEDRRTPNNPSPPERRVELGQALYDGTLIYVHSRGVVSDKEGRWRFHPLGEQLKQGRVLPDPNKEYGDVYDELVKLREKIEGITQRSEQRPEAGG